jgi:hypothetical protein
VLYFVLNYTKLVYVALRCKTRDDEDINVVRLFYIARQLLKATPNAKRTQRASFRAPIDLTISEADAPVVDRAISDAIYNFG